MAQEEFDNYVINILDEPRLKGFTKDYNLIHQVSDLFLSPSEEQVFVTAISGKSSFFFEVIEKLRKSNKLLRNGHFFSHNLEITIRYSELQNRSSIWVDNIFG